MRPLIHGASYYFARLHEELTALQAGDRVWFTDWRGDADERLLADGPSIGDLLVGHKLRIQLWAEHLGLEQEDLRLDDPAQSVCGHFRLREPVGTE